MIFILIDIYIEKYLKIEKTFEYNLKMKYIYYLIYQIIIYYLIYQNVINCIKIK